MIEIKDGKLFENDREIGFIKDGEVNGQMFSLNEEGFSLDRHPEIQTAWDKIYPGGKPKPEPGLPIPTTEQRLAAAEAAITALMGV